MRPIKAACILHTKPVTAARNWRTKKTLWTFQESPTKLLIWVHFNGRYFTVLLSCFSATEEESSEYESSEANDPMIIDGDDSEKDSFDE